MSAVVDLRPRMLHVDTSENPASPSCGIALHDGSDQVYNQAAFRYFLDVERKRSRLSARPFLLLLVGLRRSPGRRPAPAGKLFSALRRSLRETDFIGWYREGRLAGAVLTECGDMSDAGLSRHVRDRVMREMAEHLSNDIVDRLHVRVCRVVAPERS